MKILRILVSVLILTFWIVRCNTNKNIAGPDDSSQLVHSDTLYKTISAPEAKALIDSLQGSDVFMIVDVRTPNEYTDGHLENAVNIDYYSAGFSNDLEDLDKNLTYLIYCKSGSRSAGAFQTFQNKKFLKVYEMAGGISAWINAGYPVVK